MAEPIKLYLDDVRKAPDGWRLVRTIADAQVILSTDSVAELSLDHDLGACDACMKLYETKSADEWMAKSRGTSMPNCPHVGTGRTLVEWMIETGHWPINKPTVHSMNPVGAKIMRDLIDKHWEAPQ